MDRHVANAQTGGRVPGRPSAGDAGSAIRACPATRPQRPKKYLPKGPGAILGFGIKGGVEAGKQVHRWPAACSATWPTSGDAKSLAIHPASTTHSQLSEEDLISAGVTPDFIRLSVGMEDIEDILWDLEQALARV